MRKSCEAAFRATLRAGLYPSCIELRKWSPAQTAEQLTPREREIMRCVADGLSNAEIARRQWIAPSTVRKHLEHIFDKVGARSRTAALAKLRPSDLQLVD